MVAVVWLAGALSFGTAAARPVQAQDDAGQTLALLQPPQRIVSLLPALTELVCALEACNRLVGVDDFSNWPQGVRTLTRLGGLADTRIEAVAALRPDLVLLAGSTRAADRLRALGLKVLALEPRNLADLQRAARQLGPLLDPAGGAARADALLSRLDADLHALAREVPAAQRGTRVYVEIGTGPYAASESSFIGELLARLGLSNVVPGALGPFPLLNQEFVVRADPQLIVLAEREAAALAQRPGWARIDAVRNARICRFSATEADVLMRPGPRVADGARLLLRCLREAAR